MSPPVPASASVSITSTITPPHETGPSPQASPCESFNPAQIANQLLQLYNSSPPYATDSWIRAFPYSTSAAAASTAYYWLKEGLSSYQPQFSLMWTYAIGKNKNDEYAPIPRAYLKTSVCDHTYITDLTNKLHIVHPLLNYLSILENRYMGPGAWLINSPDDFVGANVRDATLSLFDFHLFTDVKYFLSDSPYLHPKFEQVIPPGTPKLSYEATAWKAALHYYKLRRAFGLY
ncbi:MAG: hypothetical protein HYU97_04755 [Deltaproteobacteria bacterium]|nr:hypothetical protein [Deltaproteobacteria bacterium]